MLQFYLPYQIIPWQIFQKDALASKRFFLFFLLRTWFELVQLSDIYIKMAAGIRPWTCRENIVDSGVAVKGSIGVRSRHGSLQFPADTRVRETPIPGPRRALSLAHSHSHYVQPTSFLDSLNTNKTNFWGNEHRGLGLKKKSSIEVTGYQCSAWFYCALQGWHIG